MELHSIERCTVDIENKQTSQLVDALTGVPYNRLQTLLEDIKLAYISARHIRDISDNRLAALLGIKQPSLSKYRNGDQRPSFGQVRAMSIELKKMLPRRDFWFTIYEAAGYGGNVIPIYEDDLTYAVQNWHLVSPEIRAIMIEQIKEEVEKNK